MTSPGHFWPAGEVGEVPEDGTRLVRIGDPARPVLLCRSGGQIHAISPWCSHAEQELACGLVREGWIACPAHGARFDLASGEPLNPPASAPLATYPVQVEEGTVFVAL
ncbi:Rieske (2Fe-2S) protein [Novosphingobium mangrovi (ex Hu et al. 2023)]|uniref:Rieske 2Fe-2S domain-containing protein n=1 Tax=Novosphingobium mangrovi (ex Hu et al. 2023) TaxID=2930094 RepID=A0ABT0AEP9_9SPHN|nr:Rieske 2Fe-2S domain-containing protein [Novosphingobium mangrovi (ex Hu et al. 2023)]MCJ1961678.1 Rieske 2Fe-2S domain-containing protein [Novosphingobium mangrovi (ex Hu et al. 2023)]